MNIRDLGEVERITAGAVGEPGNRTFYLQMVSKGRTHSVVVEKEQVQLLSTSILEILSNVGAETGGAFDDSAMALIEPITPMWRVGRISIRYEEQADRIVLEVDELRREELIEDDDEDDDEDDVDDEGDEDEDDALLDPMASLEEELVEILGGQLEPERLVASASREQMLALSRHGAAIVSKGRPNCQYCGNPMDPEGHVCPAMNGHGKH